MQKMRAARAENDSLLHKERCEQIITLERAATDDAAQLRKAHDEMRLTMLEQSKLIKERSDELIEAREAVSRKARSHHKLPQRGICMRRKWRVSAIASQKSLPKEIRRRKWQR